MTSETMEHISELLPSYREEQTNRFCELHGDYVETRFFLDDKVVETTECPECKKIKEEQEKREREERRRRERMEKNLAFSNLSNDYLDKTFSNFIAATTDDGRVLEITMRYFNNWEAIRQKGLGLLFYGNCGTGKSHLASAILHSLIVEKDTYGQFWTVRDLIDRVRKTWSESESERERIINQLRFMPLLIIDELGVQAGTPNERDVLFSIIDYRVTNKKPTILISNLNLNDLASMLGDRLMDRVTSCCVPVVFKGPSKRRKVSAKDLIF